MSGQPVLRQQVHKTDESAVFITTVENLGKAAYRVELSPAVITRGRSAERERPMLGLEVVRQLGLLLGHHAAEVPLDWAFLLDELSFELCPDLSDETDTSATVVALVQVVSARVRRSGVLDMAATVGFHLGCHVVAKGSGRFQGVPSDAYRAIRRHNLRATATKAPATEDVLLNPVFSRSQLTALLGWPAGNTLIFDHDVDHVPGMLLAQAGVESHEKCCGALPRRAHLKCSRFGEIETRTDVRAVRRGSGVVTVLSQEGNEIAIVETE